MIGAELSGWLIYQNDPRSQPMRINARRISWKGADKPLAESVLQKASARIQTICDGPGSLEDTTLKSCWVRANR